MGVNNHLVKLISSIPNRYATKSAKKKTKTRTIKKTMMKKMKRLYSLSPLSMEEDGPLISAERFFQPKSKVNKPKILLDTVFGTKTKKMLHTKSPIVREPIVLSDSIIGLNDFSKDTTAQEIGDVVKMDFPIDTPQSSAKKTPLKRKTSRLRKKSRGKSIKTTYDKIYRNRQNIPLQPKKKVVRSIRTNRHLNGEKKYKLLTVYK